MSGDNLCVGVVLRSLVPARLERGLLRVGPTMSADCHAECTIGPNADHHGTMSYRCMDENGNGLPFPGEPSTVVDLGDNYRLHIFDDA